MCKIRSALVASALAPALAAVFAAAVNVADPLPVPLPVPIVIHGVLAGSALCRFSVSPATASVMVLVARLIVTPLMVTGNGADTYPVPESPCPPPSTSPVARRSTVLTGGPDGSTSSTKCRLSKCCERIGSDPLIALRQQDRSTPAICSSHTMAAPVASMIFTTDSVIEGWS